MNYADKAVENFLRILYELYIHTPHKKFFHIVCFLKDRIDKQLLCIVDIGADYYMYILFFPPISPHFLS